MRRYNEHWLKASVVRKMREQAIRWPWDGRSPIPEGKKMPMSFKQTGNVKDGFGEVMESHFSSCPNANSFRR